MIYSEALAQKLCEAFDSCSGVLVTDSRKIVPSCLFLALKGENFDGNAFALQALEAGAALAVVDASSEAAASSDGRILAVDDTFEALRVLANSHRCRLRSADGGRFPVIGLTGTNGKTTTKELIRAVLSLKFRVRATQGNLNNDIGVPLSVLSIKPDDEIAIIEMGASHPDDISHLTEVAEPDFGLITNVGKAHLLGFGSFAGVKKAKGQLYDWLDEHSGLAFVNAADPELSQMASQRASMRKCNYSLDQAGISIVPPTPECPFLVLEKGGERFRTNLVGSYNAANALAAVTIGTYFGIDAFEALRAICSFVPQNNRSQMEKTADNTVIIDAYNANPSSMAAALDNFTLMDAPRKVLLLGSMGELGADSAREHVLLVRGILDAGFEAYLVGKEFENAVIAESAELPCFETSADLAQYLSEHIMKGATVLVKGSRSTQMEKVLPTL